MNFEFEEAKSLSNQERHGIDFLACQALWRDGRKLEIPARTEDEPRSLVVGMIEDKHWSANITHRGDRIRIIAVRPSRPEEIRLYEGG